MPRDLQSAIYLATAIDAPPVPLHAIRARARNAAPAVRRRPPLTIVTAMVLIGVLALVVIDRAFVASPAPVSSRAPSPSPTIT